MLQLPTKPEIDFRTMKLLVAIIALSLGPTVIWLSTQHLPSISFAYCDGKSARNAFVGFLYAIAAIMIAHNGVNFQELVASKFAGISAIGIAMWPTKECPISIGFNPHYLCAAVMFTTLAWFCLSFYRRAEHKPHPVYAARRRAVYAACGVGIVGTMLSMGAVSQFELWPHTNAILILETIGLALFGFSWLIASHVVPAFDHPSERVLLGVTMPVRSQPQELKPGHINNSAKQ
jgi:hypothetical protein